MLKMSPEGKRRKLQEENQEPVSAHNDPVSTHDDPVSAHKDPVSAHKDLLSSFLAWCGESGIHLNPKVSIGMEGTVAQYGMLARQDIPAGEVVFTIPRSALLSQHTTRIREMLEEEQQSLDSTSGWVPLILSLMYEATDAGSPWAPYFGLWPRLVPPDLPMFWSEKERAELLEGTGVPDAVSKDLDNIEQEYKTIVLPFILRHPEKFNPQTHTLDLYMRLVAFVMAYSFQEPMEDEDDCGTEVPPPMMVPVADLLNHVARHNTHLEFAADCLRMVTTQSVPAGHELFNTYGQMGNWQLLHMYGFSEPHPDNINDTADIQMTVLREAALQGAESEEQKAKLQERWSFLCHMEMVGEEGAFVFGCEEVLTDEELRTSLKLLCMSAEEFAEYKENDGWEEDEDNDEEEETLTYQKVACMPLSWRKLLHASAELTMKSYTTNLRSDQCILDDPAEYAKLSSRQKYSLQVRYGQKQILQRLMELTAC